AGGQDYYIFSITGVAREWRRQYGHGISPDIHRHRRLQGRLVLRDPDKNKYLLSPTPFSLTPFSRL
ncbi:MAG: hypothetical protein ABFS24_12485, partial [Pseudomonadota bacterium]